MIVKSILQRIHNVRIMSWGRKVKIKPSNFYSNYFLVQEKPKMPCNSSVLSTKREFSAEMYRFHRFESTVKPFLQIDDTSWRRDSFVFSCLDNKRTKTGRVVDGAPIWSPWSQLLDGTKYVTIRLAPGSRPEKNIAKPTPSIESLTTKINLVSTSTHAFLDASIWH